MFKLRCFALLLTCSAALLAQTTPGKLPGFDPAYIDKSVSPCDDFYQYACGLWMRDNPIPADQSRWGQFNELADHNLDTLRTILEKTSQPTPGRTQIEQQIGDYYASCMDEAGIEKLGTKPLDPVLSRIQKIGNKEQLTSALAYLHRQGIPAIFGFFAMSDYKNAAWIIPVLGQGGLSLPDRDYYLKTDPKSKELLARYHAHVAAMFGLLGDSADVANKKADTVLAIETELAKASLDRVSRRDPAKNYHKMVVSELSSLTPSIDWTAYFTAMKTPKFDSLNVQWPDFMKGVQTLIASESLDDWKVYLTWHVLRDAAPLLPKKFVDESFSFYGKTLTGVAENRPRWKRCVALVDDQLGEALGQKYVQVAFSPESKKRVLDMVGLIEKEMGKDIESLDWMTPATKKKAIEKLHAVKNKIGYPDKWRDYSAVKIDRGDALGNASRASENELSYRLNKIGTRTDPNEWGMTPPTVNAYYNPTQNNINFPAGILQPPFYDSKLDDAVNFGGIAAVIGHELTHGFDDQGRKFDGSGNFSEWWTEDDAKEFEKRADCLIKEYGSFTAVDDVKLNGKLTLGENTADNGGVRLAYMALMDFLDGKKPTKIDGYTAEQRFFLGYGQIWCQSMRPEEARLRANTDPHSPGRYRVNGVVSNLPQFQEAFSCKAGQPMARQDPCRVW